MNVESVRSYCLNFPQTKETLLWGETLCFKATGKIFAMLRLDSVPPSLCFKCTPETFAELCEQEGIRPAPYVGRYKWVLLERLDVLRDHETEDFIRQSYEMAALKAKPKTTALVRDPQCRRERPRSCETPAKPKSKSIKRQSTRRRKS